MLDTNFMVLAAMRDQLIGMQRPPGNAEALASCLAGNSLVTQPFPSVQMLQDQRGNLRAGVPTMFAAAPIRSADGQVIAILGLRIEPDTDFTRILATARSGQTGETYAFGRDGKQLSESRFDNDLKRLGLIPDEPDARSTLTLELRDPLVDLSQGRQSPKRRTGTAVHPCGERGVGGPRGRGCQWLPRLPRRAGGGRVDVAGRFQHGPGHGAGPGRGVPSVAHPADWVSGPSSDC